MLGRGHGGNMFAATVKHTNTHTCTQTQFIVVIAHTYRYTYRQTVSQRYCLECIVSVSKQKHIADRHTDRQTDRHTYIQMKGRMACGQTDGQTDSVRNEWMFDLSTSANWLLVQ